MARAVVRLFVGLFMVLAVALSVCPLAWSAEAQVGPSSTTQVTVPDTTTPPLTSSVSTTPTTVRVIKPVRPRVSVGTSTSTSTSTTTTTIAPIQAPPAPPATIPLAPVPQNANISPVFAVLSVLGLASLVGLLVAQWFLTAPGRRGPTL